MLETSATPIPCSALAARATLAAACLLCITLGIAATTFSFQVSIPQATIVELCQRLASDLYQTGSWTERECARRIVFASSGSDAGVNHRRY
jgi:hypothetical protein